MTELHFFRAAPLRSLGAIAAELQASLPPHCDPDATISAGATLALAGRDMLAFFDEQIDPAELSGTRAGACLVGPQHIRLVPPTTVPLVVDTPRQSFNRFLASLGGGALRPTSVIGARGIDTSARIYDKVLVERGVIIDPGALVGPNVEIGSDSFIGAFAVIGAGVRIGRRCSIDAQVSLVAALIGDDVTIHAGARIGQSGPRPSLGRAILQNHVEVGANAVVERGARGDTVIGEGTRIAPLQHVRADTVTEFKARIGDLPHGK